MDWSKWDGYMGITQLALHNLLDFIQFFLIFHCVYSIVWLVLLQLVCIEQIFCISMDIFFFVGGECIFYLFSPIRWSATYRNWIWSFHALSPVVLDMSKEATAKCAIQYRSSSLRTSNAILLVEENDRLSLHALFQYCIKQSTTMMISTAAADCVIKHSTWP